MTPEDFRKLKENQYRAAQNGGFPLPLRQPVVQPRPKKKRHQVELEKMRAVLVDPKFMTFANGAITFSMVPRTNSLNRAAIIGESARMVKTSAAKLWVAAVRARLAIMGFTPMSGPITLQVSAYVANIGTDIDAPLKQLMDVCKGLLWHDDSQVVNLHVEKRVATAALPSGVWMRMLPASLIDAETLERLTKSDRANGRPSKGKKR